MGRPRAVACSEIDLLAFRTLLTARVQELRVTREACARALGSSRGQVFYSQRRPSVQRFERWVRRAGFTLKEIRHFGIISRPLALEEYLAAYQGLRAMGNDLKYYIRPVVQIGALFMERFCQMGWTPSMQVHTKRWENVPPEQRSTIALTIMVESPGLLSSVRLQFLETPQLEVEITHLRPGQPFDLKATKPVTMAVVDDVRRLLHSETPPPPSSYEPSSS